MKRPNARRKLRRNAAVLVLSGLLVAVIVSISSPLASAEGGKCGAPPPVLGNFEPASAGAAAADEPFFAADGRRTLSEFRGKGLVVNFWATWCAPCVREMPQLDRLRKILAGDGIEVLALSIDRAGAPVVEKFYRTNRITNLEILIDRGGKVARRSKITAMPTTLLINARGLVVGRVIGIAEWDSPDAVAFLRRCLKP